MTTGKVYEVVEGGFQLNALVYIDRAFVFREIPDWLEGATYIKTANDDKKNLGLALSFEVNQNVTVYIAHDDKYLVKPDWLAGFEDTGTYIDTNNIMSLFQKDFVSGTVTLGSNVHPTEAVDHNMYSVIIVGNGSPAPAAPTRFRLTREPAP